LFECGQSRFVRKLVYNYIATWADPDGSEAYPSRETIARDCGLTVRGLSNVVLWLENHCLLKVEYKASRLATNRYTVLFSEGNQAECRAAVGRDEEQERLRNKAEQTSLARSAAAKSRWAKKKTERAEGPERNVLTEQPNVSNAVFLQDAERIASDSERVACEPGTRCISTGTECIAPGTQSSHNRPADRPGVNRPEVNRQSTPSTAPSPTSSDVCASENPVDVVADARLNPINSSGQGEGAALSPDCFMAEVTKVLWRRRLSTRTTQSHRDRAIALARVHSPKLFIAALDRWVINEYMEVAEIDRGLDLRTSRPRVEERTWVLDYFMSSGSAGAYIERTKTAFALGVRQNSECIEVVCRVLENEHQLTPEQAQSLADLVKGEDELGYLPVCRAVEYADTVEDFLNNPQEYLEMLYTAMRGGRPREKGNEG
jgi:hypothetical protein